LILSLAADVGARQKGAAGYRISANRYCTCQLSAAMHGRPRFLQALRNDLRLREYEDHPIAVRASTSPSGR
jgi:hypothetical protein